MELRQQGQAVLETTLEKLSSLVPGRPGAGKTADLSFIGLDGEVLRSYNYPGGRLLAGAGLSEEGELLVGITRSAHLGSSRPARPSRCSPR